METVYFGTITQYTDPFYGFVGYKICDAANACHVILSHKAPFMDAFIPMFVGTLFWIVFAVVFFGLLIRLSSILIRIISV